MKLLVVVFYRNLIAYYYTALLAAGSVTKRKFSDFETLLIMNQLLLPDNVNSRVILKVCNDFDEHVADICMRQATRQRIFSKYDRKVSSNVCKQPVWGKFGLG